MCVPADFNPANNSRDGETVARLKLFLSTTSEMAAERALIGEIIDGVNRVIEDLCGATIS